MDAWLDFARGPLFRFAIAVLVLGVLRHIVLAIVSIRTALGRAGDKSLPWKQLRRTTLAWIFPLKHLTHKRVFTIASVAFHVGLILAPLFLMGHVQLVERSIGISWPTLPAVIADILTLTAIAGILVVLGARLSSQAARSLTRPYDILILGLVFLPLATGFLAMHTGLNPFAFELTLLFHFLSGSILLALIPFTKLVHVVFFPATQLISEVGWRFRPDAGERVAKALGKENQPV